MGLQCVQCKGTKMLCGKVACPLLIQMQSRKGLEDKLKDNELLGQSPSVFVGSFNYPKVFVGPLTGSQLSMDDESSRWYGTPLDKIIDYRTQLFRGKEAIRTDEALNPGKRLSTIQEIAMSEKHVDTDLVFKKKPKLDISFNQTTAPYGPTGDTQSLILESNPKIPRVMDKTVSDELKSVEGMMQLYSHDITMDEIQRVLSVGLLGIQKKLVPTRWSITASDDTIGKKLLDEIRDFDELDEYLVFESDYLSNHFQIILTPGKWSFEQLEYYVPGSVWVKENEDPIIMKDSEGYYNRTKYAFNVAGGYYAGRLGVCEGLIRMKRQATSIIVREIGSGYYAPVGVWQVRESVRHAMKSKPEKFGSLNEALESVASKLEAKNRWEKQSELLSKARSRDIMRKFMT